MSKFKFILSAILSMQRDFNAEAHIDITQGVGVVSLLVRSMAFDANKSIQYLSELK